MKNWLDKKFKISFLNVLGLFVSIKEINEKREENLKLHQELLGLEPTEENLELLRHLKLEYEILMLDHRSELERYEWEMKKMNFYFRMAQIFGGQNEKMA